MWERTLTVSSLGKTHSLTGLEGRLGDRPGRARRARAGRQAVPQLRGRHAAPARRGGRHGAAGRRSPARARLRAKRDRLAAGLREAGFEVLPSAGHLLPQRRRPRARRGRRGAPVPVAAARGRRRGDPAVRRSAATPTGAVRSIVRFAFCKRDDVLDEAIERLTPGRAKVGYGLAAGSDSEPRRGARYGYRSDHRDRGRRADRACACRWCSAAAGVSAGSRRVATRRARSGARPRSAARRPTAPGPRPTSAPRVRAARRRQRASRRRAPRTSSRRRASATSRPPGSTRRGREGGRRALRHASRGRAGITSHGRGEDGDEVEHHERLALPTLSASATSSATPRATSFATRSSGTRD